MFKKGNKPWNKGIKGFRQGHKVSKEARKKIGKANSGRVYSEKSRAKMSKAKIGTFRSKETKRKIGDANRGAKSYLWKGGITTYERKLYLNLRRRARN